jgi:hypothetical protein
MAPWTSSLRAVNGRLMCVEALGHGEPVLTKLYPTA